MLVGAGLFLLVTAAIVRPRLVDTFKTGSLLALDSIDGDLLEEHLGQVSHPTSTLEAFWESGKISHRRAVLELLLNPGAPTNTFRSQVLRESLTDPDLHLRERALGFLSPLVFPDFKPLLGGQLTDPDPEVRRLAIQTLRRVGDLAWVPSLLPLLADPDPSLVLAVDSLLRRWTGQDSGLRLTNSLPGQQGLVPVDHQLTSETRQRLAGAPAFWQTWWSGTTQPSNLVFPMVPPPPARRPVADFELADLQGNPRKLSDFRGRVVLLNFWATWCTPCAVEMPALAALQRNHPDDLVILGVSLDSFQEGPLAGSSEKPAKTADEAAALRRLVGSFAARQRIQYPILLDPSNTVARRFEGNELPTQVLIDPAGRLVRRFVGGRSPDAWEALVRHALANPP
jgi:thiol-disulfide isomerase/thioredoxin